MHAGSSAGMAQSNKARAHLARTEVWVHTAQRPDGSCHLPLLVLLFAWVTPQLWGVTGCGWREKLSLAKCFDIINVLAFYLVIVFFVCVNFCTHEYFFCFLNIHFQLIINTTILCILLILLSNIQQKARSRFFPIPHCSQKFNKWKGKHNWVYDSSNFALFCVCNLPLKHVQF